MAGLETILNAADFISQLRGALARIDNLETGSKVLADANSALEKRVRELEALLREAKSEIRLEAVKETHTAINAVQGQFNQDLRELAVKVDRLEGRVGMPGGVTPVPRLDISDGGILLSKGKSLEDPN